MRGGTYQNQRQWRPASARLHDLPSFITKNRRLNIRRRIALHRAMSASFPFSTVPTFSAIPSNCAPPSGAHRSARPELHHERELLRVRPVREDTRIRAEGDRHARLHALRNIFPRASVSFSCTSRILVRLPMHPRCRHRRRHQRHAFRLHQRQRLRLHNRPVLERVHHPRRRVTVAMHLDAPLSGLRTATCPSISEPLLARSSDQPRKAEQRAWKNLRREHIPRDNRSPPRNASEQRAAKSR